MFCFIWQSRFVAGGIFAFSAFSKDPTLLMVCLPLPLLPATSCLCCACLNPKHSVSHLLSIERICSFVINTFCCWRYSSVQEEQPARPQRRLVSKIFLTIITNNGVSNNNNS